MTIFSRAKPVSSLALAMALAVGATATTFVAVAAPAYAQRNRDKDKDEEAQPQYSEEFIAAYQPLNAASQQEPADWATVAAGAPGLIAVTLSNDEKIVTGGLIYNAGAQTQNSDLQLQGMMMMLESGKVRPEVIGRYNYIAYELLRNSNRHAESRPYLQLAIDYDFTNNGQFTKLNMIENMRRSFTAEGDYVGASSYLTGEINRIEGETGSPADVELYAALVSMTYNNSLVPQVYDAVQQWVSSYPDTTNWRDAIGIVRNLNDFTNAELLDLMRLGSKLGTLDRTSDYLLYIESADPRRLPLEVKNAIDQGYALGVIDRTDEYVSESLTTANSRIASDRAELPALESDASAPDAGYRTVIAAGNAFLSYGEYDKAETFFKKGINMAGVNRNEALTRLGMAQAELGKYEDAEATLSQVEGARVPIAKLWIAYAAQLAAEQSAPAATTAAVVEG
jgi:tetratricopeptide (TPR) repeat protein